MDLRLEKLQKTGAWFMAFSWKVADGMQTEERWLVTCQAGLPFSVSSQSLPTRKGAGLR